MLPVVGRDPMGYMCLDGSIIQTIAMQEAYREIRIISYRTMA